MGFTSIQSPRRTPSTRCAPPAPELKLRWGRQIIIASGEPHEKATPEVPRFACDGKRVPTAMPVLGGIVGGTLGYLLTTLTQHSYPILTGGMPLSPTWTNGIIVYEMTMLGAILTTLVTLLIGAGLPNFKGVITDKEIWAGKILVGVVDPPDGSELELERRLQLAGATQIKRS